MVFGVHLARHVGGLARHVGGRLLPPRRAEFHQHLAGDGLEAIDHFDPPGLLPVGRDGARAWLLADDGRRRADEQRGQNGRERCETPDSARSGGRLHGTVSELV
jgi:hypothetical protein